MSAAAEFVSNSYSYLDHQRAMRETYGMDAASKAAYLDGLLAGMMGFPSLNLSGPALMGYQLGEVGRAKSEELRAQRADAGRRSAEARKQKNGSARPPKSEQRSERRSNGVHENNERRSNEAPNSVPNDAPTPFGGDAAPEKMPEIFDGKFLNAVHDFPERRSNGVHDFPEQEGRKEGNRKADAFLKTPCKSDLSANSARESSERGGVGQICKKRGWQDLSSRPSLENFLAYAAEQWPEWHRDDLERIYAGLVRRNWTDQDGAKIANWQSLLASFRFHVDPAHLGERYPLGQFVRSLLEGAA